MIRNPSQIDAIFGARARALRMQQGWSGRELARKAELHASTEYRAEQGNESITLAVAVKLARALGESLDRMLIEPECSVCADLPLGGFTCNACSRSGDKAAGSAPVSVGCAAASP